MKKKAIIKKLRKRSNSSLDSKRIEDVVNNLVKVLKDTIAKEKKISYSNVFYLDKDEFILGDRVYKYSEQSYSGNDNNKLDRPAPIPRYAPIPKFAGRTHRKPDIVSAMAKELNISQNEAKRLYDTITTVMISTLKRGDDLLITGFVQIRCVRGEMGRNRFMPSYIFRGRSI